MQIRGKNVGILIYRSILHQIGPLGENRLRLPNPLSQKIDLQIERPTVHIIVEVTDIGIIAILVIGPRTGAVGKDFSQRGLPRTDISGNGNIHDL